MFSFFSFYANDNDGSILSCVAHAGIEARGASRPADLTSHPQ